MINYQNPPSIPTLLIGHIVSLFRGSKLIIDWHNFGWTLLALSKGRYHPFVVLYKWYEHFFGQGAFANLCVTNAMRSELDNNWNVKAHVLYDKPAKHFQRLNIEQMHEVRWNLRYFFFLCEIRKIQDLMLVRFFFFFFFWDWLVLFPPQRRFPDHRSDLSGQISNRLQAKNWGFVIHNQICGNERNFFTSTSPSVVG